ncbi:hypothetical protein ANCCEY_04621 [Ancylostoma ceylanicum]|uniref:Major facilitator superfamily (MFS) profile domain-containing protein n=1 Tax=Ancylostoma ceylanicum TaxID=53326 RepID=A0A0D6LYQ9_9BILA|nr:hypothetical protein ANCCEY_04621 [Ancylostoma ceylanicum]
MELLEAQEPEIPRWRYVIVVLATSAAAIGLSCSFAFNFASVCKVNGTLDTYEIYQRIMQGASVAPTVPLVGHVTAYWTPRAEIGVFVSLLTSYSQIGLFYLMATSGIMCEYFAWRGIFYFNGLSSLAIGILWVFMFRDHPSEMKQSKSVEEKCNKPAVRRSHEPVPYKAFFTSLPIWSCLVGAFGNFGGISPFMTFAPSILKKALNLTDIATSQYNTCSFIIQLSLKLFSGRMSDVWTSVNETNKVRLFNSLSLGVAGIICISTAFVPAENQVVCALLITLLQGTIGFNAGGFNRAAVIVARRLSLSPDVHAIFFDMPFVKREALH